MSETAPYCLIFKDPHNGFVWTREFFAKKLEADQVMSRLPAEAEAFFRQHVVVSTGSNTTFLTKAEAEKEAARLKKRGESPGITIFNPGFSGSAELLYSDFSG